MVLSFEAVCLSDNFNLACVSSTQESSLTGPKTIRRSGTVVLPFGFEISCS